MQSSEDGKEPAKDVPEAEPKPESKPVSDTPPARPAAAATTHVMSAGIRKLLVLLSILMLLVALGTGWLLWKESRASADPPAKKTAATTTPEQTEPADLTCDEGLSAYQNQDIGFGFCYPGTWGAISVVDAKFAAADTGKRWRVNFADKPEVHLNLKSTDWSTKEGRDGVCRDLAGDIPDFAAAFSEEWTTNKEGSEVVYVERGLAVSKDKYLVRETADSLLLSGVCLEGYAVLDNTTYEVATATYSVSFNEDTVANPAAHMADPNRLVQVADREAFVAFAQSVQAF